METIKDIYDQLLFGIGPLSQLVLIFISIIIICLIGEKEKKRLISGMFIMYFLVFNPYTIYVLATRFYSHNRIGRLAWGLPFLELIIFGVVELIFCNKKSSIKWAGVAIMLVLCLDVVSNHIKLEEESRSNMYVTDDNCLAIAKILQKENNTEMYCVWSDELDIVSMRQYLPLLMDVKINGYVGGDGKTRKEWYGDRYSAYMIIQRFCNNKDLAKEDFVKALDRFETKYYILSNETEYNFLLDYHMCELIGSVNGYNVYRIE